MLSIFLTEKLETVAQSQDAILAYFFCDYRDNRRNTAVAVLRGLMFQLIRQHPKLIEHIVPILKFKKRLYSVFHPLSPYGGSLSA